MLRMLELSWASVSVVAVALGVTVCWQYWRWTHRRLLKLASMVPGPPAWPIIGNAHIFIARPEDLLDIISALLQKYGQYVRFWLGPDLNICVKNPADIRLLLTSNKVNHKGPCYNFMLPFIGPGILTGGPTWRNHRKIANPSYNKRSVQHFSKIFNEEAQHLARVLMGKDLGETFNVFHYVLDTTTQCVCQTLMGLSKKDSQNVTRMTEVIRMTQNMYTLIFMKMTRWFYQIPLVYRLIGGQKKEDFYIRAIDDMTSDIVRKRRQALAEAGVSRLEDADDAMGIVDRYILSGELTEREIQWETFSLFTTSQEASAKIASAVLLFLAHLPEWQDKVHEEIVQRLGPHDGPVSEEEVKQLVHLDMVYKEVLRYLSIAAMVQRTVDEEIVINQGTITLPVGTSLVIPIHVLHRDPQYWDEPDKVKPERWLPENCKNRDPNAFVPFSLGPMDCLGRVYATALIKILVVRVLRNVIFEADGRLEDLDIHVAISVRFAKGYNLRARPRKLRKTSNVRVHA